jgi:hypothetical protein
MSFTEARSKIRSNLAKLFHKVDIFVLHSYKGLILATWLIFGLGFYWISIDNTFPVYKFKIISYNLVKVNKYRENIVLKEEICSSSRVELRIDTEFTDSIVYNVPDSLLIIKRGCTLLMNSLPLPEGIAPDTYHFITSLTGKINPLKDMTVRYNLMTIKVNKDDPKFTIIPNKAILGTISEKINYLAVAPVYYPAKPQQ